MLTRLHMSGANPLGYACGKLHIGETLCDANNQAFLLRAIIAPL